MERYSLNQIKNEIATNLGYADDEGANTVLQELVMIAEDRLGVDADELLDASQVFGCNIAITLIELWERSKKVKKSTRREDDWE